MMFDKELFKAAFRVGAGTDGVVFVKVMDVTVNSVDKPKRICYVSSVDNTKAIDNFPARLMPEISDGELTVPEKDSIVTICWSEFTYPFVVNKSWLEEKITIIGNQGWHITKENQVFNDGAYGGIPRVINPDDNEKALLTKINNLEKLVNKLNDRLEGFIDMHSAPTWTVVPNDGGAALQAAVGIWTAVPTNAKPDNLTETTQEDIENPNITHGKDIPE